MDMVSELASSLLVYISCGLASAHPLAFMDVVEEEPEGRTNTRYNLHPKPRNMMQYAMLQSTEDLITLPKTHTHIMMTQLNIQEGLKAYGEKGDEAIMKGIEQLHTRKALLPCNRYDMTYDERKKALRYLMFLKEKRVLC